MGRITTSPGHADCVDWGRGRSMRTLLRLIAAPALAVCLSLPSHPVAAAGSTAHAPRVFQVTPARVNPVNEPNIMLVGQNLTPTTQVTVGGRPAVTVEATG